MGQLEDAFKDAADEVAQIKAQPSSRYWWLYGTIKAKNSNGTLDVEIDGVTIQQVKATISCLMSDVGNRVIILKAGPIMTCVDVISRDRFTAVTTAVNSLGLFTTPTALTNDIKQNPEGKHVYFIIGHSSTSDQKKGLIRAVGSIGDTRGENRCSFDIVLDFTRPVAVHVNHLVTSSTAGISIRKASDGCLWLYAWTTSELSWNSVSAAVLYQSAVDGYWANSEPEGELIWSGDSAASSSLSPGLFSGMSIGTGLKASGRTLSVGDADYIKLAAGAFADDNGKNGVYLFRWGPLRVIQVQFTHVAKGGTEFGHLPDSEVPRGGMDALGYLYVQGAAGSCGQVKVNYRGEVSAWMDRDSDYCSGQVVFFV